LIKKFIKAPQGRHSTAQLIGLEISVAKPKKPDGAA
jgi:hypothetical protein